MPIYEYKKRDKNRKLITHYYYAFEVKDEKGSRKTFKERGFMTKAAAKDAEAVARTIWNKGEYITPNKTLYKDYLLDWLNKRTDISIDTKYYYMSYYNNHILDSKLGKLQLTEITTSSIEDFIFELLEKESDKGTKLSSSFVNLVLNFVNTSLNYAVRKKIISSNPAKYADRPRIAKKDMKYWSVNDVRKFLSGFDDRCRIIFFLAIYTGMRIGESLGLRMDDIDLENRRIYIRQILISRNKRLKAGAKTQSSNRSISISNHVVAEIAKHMKLIQTEKMNMREAYFDRGLLICNKDGRPMDDSYSRKLFIKFIKKTGVPLIRIHDLRHTFASLLLQAGQHPKVVQEMLGHSNIRLTMDTYSHLTPNMQVDAADALESILNAPVLESKPTENLPKQ